MGYEYDINSNNKNFDEENNGSFLERLVMGFCNLITFGRFQGSTVDGNIVKKPKSSVEYDKESFVYTLTVDLPGISRDKVTIQATDDALKVEANRPSLRDPEKLVLYKKTFEFKRLIVVEKVKATYNDGRLTIVVPAKEKPSSSIDLD